MKNSTAIAIIVALVLVWAIMKRRGIRFFTNFGFNPTGAAMNTSTQDAGKGADIFQGYDYTELYQHVSGLKPVDEGSLIHPPTNNKPKPVGPEPYNPMPGNFANGDGSGYSAKLGIVTNNVRMLPGKVNSGNRQGIGMATYRNT